MVVLEGGREEQNPIAVENASIANERVKTLFSRPGLFENIRTNSAVVILATTLPQLQVQRVI
jgi:hypothetical protein